MNISLSLSPKEEGKTGRPSETSLFKRIKIKNKQIIIIHTQFVVFVIRLPFHQFSIEFTSPSPKENIYKFIK